MAVSIPKLPGDLPTGQPRWVGQPMRRVEDPLLVSGRAEFTDNLRFPGMLHCAFVRSPHAHARILRIDMSKALALPGVVAVATGDDAQRETERPWGAPPGFSAYCIATDKARFSGEPVAAVAAISRYVAEDGVDLIEVEYEPLPAVVDARKGMQEGTPLLYEERGTNVMFQRDFKFGDVDKAFAEAHLVVSESYRFPRVSANPIETNGCIVGWDPLTAEVTAWGTFQTPIFRLPMVCGILRLTPHMVRLFSQPYGGSFGSKGGVIRYLGAVAVLSKKCGGRPVKWIEDRVEHLRAGGSDAWERFYEGELAFDRDGRATGFRVKCIDDQGANVEYAGMAVKPISQLTSCYDIPTCEYDITAVATNKNPQSAYRGYGPPPNTLLLEWLMDKGARALNLDPADIRRRNLIPPDKFPYTLSTGNQYDSGNYPACLDALLEMSSYRERRRAQAEARKQGRLVGLGLAGGIETGVPSPLGTLTVLLTGRSSGRSSQEGAVVRIDASGKIVVEVGFSSGGQGQHTFVTQILADYFGVPPLDITVRTVDSQTSPPGVGPIGSRQAAALSGAVLGAAERVKDKLAKVAAVLLEANEADVELLDGRLGVRGVPQKALSLAQVAAAMLYRADLLPPGVDGSPEASYVWNGPDTSLPDEQGRGKYYLTAANSMHLVEVEVDRKTGQVQILGYWVVDDCGTRLNPAIVEGQTQGGLAQGVGVALLEEYVYDDESGERLSSTFMDYLLPTIHEVPQTEKVAITTPSPFTPLGAKGSGEGAIHTTPAALYCAVNDALAPLGAVITELPMSPPRVWKAMQGSDRGRPQPTAADRRDAR